MLRKTRLAQPFGRRTWSGNTARLDYKNSRAPLIGIPWLPRQDSPRSLTKKEFLWTFVNLSWQSHLLDRLLFRSLFKRLPILTTMSHRPPHAWNQLWPAEPT